MPQRVRQTIYSLPKKRPKSGQKVENAIKHHTMLLKRRETDGNTAWVQNAVRLNTEKLRRYGVMHLLPEGTAQQAPRRNKNVASR